MRILKINSLPSIKEHSWIDRDYIMLHACFQILQDFVEKEDAITYYDTYDDKTYENFVSELKELYGWWLWRKDNDSFDDDEKDNEMLNRLMKIRLSLWT